MQREYPGGWCLALRRWDCFSQSAFVGFHKRILTSLVLRGFTNNIRGPAALRGGSRTEAELNADNCSALLSYCT